MGEKQFDVEYTKLKSSVTTYVKSHVDDWKDSIISAVFSVRHRHDHIIRATQSVGNNDLAAGGRGIKAVYFEVLPEGSHPKPF